MATYEEIQGSLFQLNQQLINQGVDAKGREPIMNDFLKENYGIDFVAYDMMLEQQQKFEKNRPFEILVGSVRQGFQGMTLGLGDEIEGFLRSELGKYTNVLGDEGKAYEQIKNEIQAGIEGFEKANPKSSFALEMAGGFAIPFLGTGVNLTRKGVQAILPFMKSGTGKELVTQAVVGAGLGAGYEYGKTDEVTLKGTATGGGFGVAGQAVGQAIGKGVSKLKDTPYVGSTARFIESKVTGGDPPDKTVGSPPKPTEQPDPNLPAKTIDAESLARDREAMRLIIERAEQQNLRFDELTDELIRFNNTNRGGITSIYDLSTMPDPMTGKPLGLTNPVPDLALGNIVNAPRASGVAQRNFERRALGAKDRAMDDVNKLFGTIPKQFGDVFSFKDVRKQTMKKNAQPFYDIADPTAINDAEFPILIKQALQRSEAVQKAYKDAYRDIVAKGFPAVAEPQGMTVRQFDRFKKALDSQITKLLKDGDQFNASSLMDIRTNLINYVDDVLKRTNPVPANSKQFPAKYAGESPYKVARDFYAGDESADMAFELGLNAVSNTSKIPFNEDLFKYKYDKLTTPEKRMTILGLGAGLRDLLKRQGVEELNVRRLLQGGAGENTMQNILRHAINNIDLTLEGGKRQAGARKRLERFEEAMKAERQLLGNFRKIFRGSDSTQKNLASERAKTGVRPVAQELAELGSQIAGGPTMIPPIYKPAGLLYRGAKALGFYQDRALQEQMERLSDAISARLTDPNVIKNIEDLKNYQRLLNMRYPQKVKSGLQTGLNYSLLDERR